MNRKDMAKRVLYALVFLTTMMIFSLHFGQHRKYIRQITTPFTNSERREINVLATWLRSIVKPQEALKLVSTNCSQICPTRYQTERGYPQYVYFGKYPEFMTADIFRDMSDYIVNWVDNRAPFYENISKIPSNYESLPVVKCLGISPIIYIRGDKKYVRPFITNILPFLTSPFVLITGNSDEDIPHVSTTALLHDKRLIHWYTQDPNYSHPKFSPIPIGVAYYAGIHLKNYHPQLVTIREFKDNARIALESYRNKSLTRLLALRFSNTHPVRKPLKKHYCGLPFVDCSDRNSSEPMNFTDNYRHLDKFPFWLSPRGNGLDFYRTYEALYLGRIPVVETSYMDPVLKDLPVLILKDLMNVTEELLVSELRKVLQKDYDLSTLLVSYWRKEIEKKRSNFIAQAQLNESNFPQRVQCWGTSSKSFR